MTNRPNKKLLVTRNGPLVTMILNRPEARNAVDDELRELLRGELAAIAAEDTVRVVILTGAGRAFCAGGDVRGMSERLRAAPGAVAGNGVRRQRRTFELVDTLYRLPQVAIAALNGPAVGLGLDLALACDVIVCSSAAWVAASFVDRGLVPDGGSMYFLPRRIGLSRAKDVLLSGRRVGAAEAHGMGLVDVVADNDVMQAAGEMAARFSGKPAVPLMLTKEILNRSIELSLEVVSLLGSEAQGICYTTDDHRASVEAFLAKDRG